MHHAYLAVLSVLGQTYSDTDHGEISQGPQKHVVSLPLCRINTQQRLLPALYVHVLDCFLIKLRTTSQGWPHPQWVGSAKSAIRQENALQPCNVVGCFLDWSLFSEDSSFCQADEKLVSAALKTVLFFIYVCVCGVMHVYMYMWVCAYRGQRLMTGVGFSTSFHFFWGCIYRVSFWNKSLPSLPSWLYWLASKWCLSPLSVLAGPDLILYRCWELNSAPMLCQTLYWLSHLFWQSSRF